MKPLQQVNRTCVREGGRTLIYFGGCDYFRLASDPRIHQALRDGLASYGLNVAASRVTTGEHRLYQELERELAQFFGAPAAVLVASGYSADLAAAQALRGKIRTVLIDEEAHSALNDAVCLLDCRIVQFKHRSPTDLARRVDRHSASGPLLVATDGMFALTGMVAPLAAYLAALPRSALLLVDDAHAAGLLGPTGKGTVENLDRRRVIQTVTLSKAFGVYGGAILGARGLKERIVPLSGVFRGSTALPLPLAAAALESLRVVRDNPQLRKRLWANASHLAARLNLKDRSVESPILAFTLKSSRAAAKISRRLNRAGIHAPLIAYGTRKTEHLLRFAVSSEHTREQLDRLAHVLIECNCLLTPAN